jgi:GTPase involved in cell partitioning and DNA repair
MAETVAQALGENGTTRGVPDGGKGARGGEVVFVTDGRITDLGKFLYYRRSGGFDGQKPAIQSP